MAVEGRRDAEEAEQGGDAYERHLKHRRVALEEHDRVEGEDVGHDERRNGKLRGVDGGLHRLGLGNCAAGVGGQSHRRRDVGHDAEVEDEEVRGNHGDAQLNEDGRARGGHDAIVGRGGNTHAQNDAAHHGEQQTQDGGVASDGDDAVDEHGGKTGQRDAASDKAGHGAGNAHRHGALGTSLESLKGLLQGEHRGLGKHLTNRLALATLMQVVQEEVDIPDEEGGKDGDGGRPSHGAGTRRDEPHEQHKRQQQVAVLAQIAPRGQVLTRKALEPELLGLEVHGDEDAGEVQHGGQDGLGSHVDVGNAHVLGHEERRRTHDGGHDLATGGRCCLNGAGELRLEAGLLHHGDGDGARGDGVAHRGAAHHAAQGARDDSHLCGAAARPASKAVGQGDEEIGDARALQERAEDDEEHDVGVAHVDGCADDTVHAVEQAADDVLEHLERVGVVAAAPNHDVDEQGGNHDENRDTHAATAQLEQHEDAHDAHHDERQVDAVVHHDDVVGVERKVEERACAQHHENDVVPRDAVGLDMVLVGRVNQEADDDDAAQEQRQARLGQHGAEERHVQAVHGERRHDAADNGLGDALPHACIRLAVVLLHYRVDISLHFLGRKGGLAGICHLFTPPRV